jgi:outer membrane lipoprotein-sorting protein
MVAALLLALLSACVPLAITPSGVKVDDQTGTTLLEEWQQRAAQVFAVQGIANAKVSTPERNVSGTQVVLAERPDHFRAESLSPFGTPLLTLAANGDQLSVLLPAQNVFYTGSASAENLGRFTRLPLKPVDLVDLLLYRAPLITARRRTTYALHEGGWQVTLNGALRRQELVFDAERRLVDVRYFERDTLFLRIGYQNFDELVANFPAQFIIEVPEFATTARLAFTELAINRTFQPGIFHLKAPDGATIYNLGSNP